MTGRVCLALVLLAVTSAVARADDPAARYCDPLVSLAPPEDRAESYARCADVIHVLGEESATTELARALGRLAGLDGWLRLREKPPEVPTPGPVAAQVQRNLDAQRAFLARIYPPTAPGKGRSEAAVTRYCAQRIAPLPARDHAEALVRCRDVVDELASSVRVEDLDRLAALDGWLRARATGIALPADATPEAREQLDALAGKAKQATTAEGEMLSKMYPPGPPRPRPRAKIVHAAELPNPFGRDPFGRDAGAVATRKQPIQPVVPKPTPKRPAPHDLMDPFGSTF